MSGQGLLQRLVTDTRFYYQHVYATPSYPWQVEISECIERIVHDARNGRLERGEEMVVLCSRQAGKNETSARTEARLLMKYRSEGGAIIKCAPTWTPQLNISKERLRDVTQRPLFRGRKASEDAFQWEEGRTCRCGNAKLTLVSAEPSAQKVGHTASIMLEVDEAQDVDSAIYSKDFRPMCSTRLAPTVLYGTVWDLDTLLEQKRHQARERQKQIGRRLLFEVPWTKVAEFNDEYRKYVEGEIALLGLDHPVVKTQYCLEALESAGRLFSKPDVAKMRSQRPRRHTPHDGAVYVAGIDLCGSDEQDLKEALVKIGTDANEKRDSTAVTICALTYRWEHAAQRRVPVLQVVDHLLMAGTHPLDAVEHLYNFVFERWRCLYAVIDAQGVGDAVAHVLQSRRPNQVTALKSTVSEVSRLGFNLLAAVKTGRLSVYQHDDSEESWEFWRQAEECRRELRPNGQMRFMAPPTKTPNRNGVKSDTHDDLVKSLSYAVEAAEKHLALYLDDGVLNAPEPYRHDDAPRFDDFDDY